MAYGKSSGRLYGIRARPIFPKSIQARSRPGAATYAWPVEPDRAGRVQCDLSFMTRADI